MIWKESHFSDMENLKMFVNTPTADDKYSVLSRENLMQTIQMHLSEKKNRLNYFALISNLHQILTVIAYVYLKIRTPKDMVR